LQAECTQLRTDKDAAEAPAASLRAECTQLRTDKGAAEAQAASLQAECTQLRTEKDKAQSQCINFANQLNARLAEQVNDLKRKQSESESSGLLRCPKRVRLFQ